MAKGFSDFVREARARIQELRAEELDDMIENHDDLLILDVREPQEYAAGHIPGALNVPRGLLEVAADPQSKGRVETLATAQDRTVVTYCASGGRSAMAADTLKQMGFDKTYSLAGGIATWTAGGMPVVKD